jgi:carboxymethylenebutenolidase
VTSVGTEVTLGAAGRSGRGYLSEPAGTGPGVVVVHDGFGLLPHVRSRCDWLAEAGFVALAIDLYDGRVARTPAEAERLAGEVDQVRARGLVAIAATQLLARPKVRPQRVGAVGFGLGGRLALLAAATGALDAIVAFYAVLEQDERSLVPCPTLLHLTGGPMEQDAVTRGFLHELRTSGTELTARTWSGVPPGFANADRPDYRDKPAVAAWVETAGFLAGHLRR